MSQIQLLPSLDGFEHYGLNVWTYCIYNLLRMSKHRLDDYIRERCLPFLNALKNNMTSLSSEFISSVKVLSQQSTPLWFGSRCKDQYTTPAKIFIMPKPGTWKWSRPWYRVRPYFPIIVFAYQAFKRILHRLRNLWTDVLREWHFSFWSAFFSKQENVKGRFLQKHKTSIAPNTNYYLPSHYIKTWQNMMLSCQCHHWCINNAI